MNAWNAGDADPSADGPGLCRRHFTSRPEFHLSDRCARWRAPCKAWCEMRGWQRRGAQ